MRLNGSLPKLNSYALHCTALQEAAWAAGGSGVLLKTTNGGKNWVCDKAADNIAASLYSVK